MIRYFRHHEIDKQKWDNALDQCLNKIVYAQSWYLDIVAPGWEALIDDDYISIMPLPAKRKYLLPYLIQPRFTQQLGVYSKREIDTSLVALFLQNIPRKFVWYDINLNSENITKQKQGISFQDNYELNLGSEYEIISQGFNENTRRNIRKSEQSGIIMLEKNQINGIQFVSEYCSYSKIKPDKIARFQLQQLVTMALELGLGDIYIMKDSENNMLGGAFFLNQFNRLIYLVSFLSEKGKQESAMFFLINKMIKDNSGFDRVLDFEGSLIPGIATFFKSFGSTTKPYPRLKYSIIN